MASTLSDLQQRFAQSRADLAVGLLERGVEVGLMQLATVSQTSAVFVGAPGCAKSFMVSKYMDWIRDAEYWDYNFSRTTIPDEVFGPISLPNLKQSKFERDLTRTLATATHAFLDEVYKSNSAVANGLLRVMNERTYKNGQQWVKCPLRVFFAASNEWDNSNGESQELGAFSDRFLIKREVKMVEREDSLMALLTNLPTVQHSTSVTVAELDQATAESRALPWSESACDTVLEIRAKLAKDGITVGDRRWSQGGKIAQAAAWLQGHNAVEREDLDCLKHVWWDDPNEQPAKAAKIIGKLANPVAYRVGAYLKEAADAISAANIRGRSFSNPTERNEVCGELETKLLEIQDKLSKVKGPRAKAASAKLAADIEETAQIALRVGFAGSSAS